MITIVNYKAVIGYIDRASNNVTDNVTYSSITNIITYGKTKYILISWYNNNNVKSHISPPFSKAIHKTKLKTPK